MEYLCETFTDEEFAELKKAKVETVFSSNWHDFIMYLTTSVVREDIKMLQYEQMEQNEKDSKE